MPRPVPPKPDSTLQVTSLALVADSTNYELPKPILAPSPPFLLQFHPRRWQVYEVTPGVFEVLPYPGQLALQPGVGNVSRTRSGALDPRDAIETRRRGGWNVLPHDVDGPGTSYLREPSPGCFTSRFERIDPSSGVIVSDVEAFCSWLRGLVARGLVRPISAAMAAQLVEKCQQELYAAADAASRGTPSAVRDRDRAEARLAAARAAHAAAIERERQ
jgi:hypothetical protein